MKAKLIVTGFFILLLLVLSGCTTGGHGSGRAYSLRTRVYDGPEVFYRYGYYGDYYRYSPYSGYYYSPGYYPYYYSRRYYAPFPGYNSGNSKRNSGRGYLDRDGYHKGSR